MSKVPRYRVIYAVDALLVTRVIREFTDDELVDAQKIADENHTVVEDLGAAADVAANLLAETPTDDENTIIAQKEIL